IVNTPDCRIVDYVAGHCGSAHDSTVFVESSLALKPEVWLAPNEFVWADSAYSLRNWCITPYHRPEHNIPVNRKFNYHMACVRIKAEHTIGFLKGHFSSLRGLRQQIKDERDHELAVYWVISCLILH
ncbi:hypothetical protein BS47DRAFT_1258617, partial [Hydnum rufescens UP504]